MGIMTRCFVAVGLPDGVRAALAHAQQELRETHTFAGNDVDPASMHITLAFLGDLSDKEIADTKAALQTVRRAPFGAKLDGLGAFGHPARIVWAGLEENGMQRLYAQVHDALGPRAFDERDYSAHITLSRVKRVKDGPALREALKRCAPPPIGFTVGSFTLMRSKLAPDGPVYELIETYPLTSGDDA